MPDAFPLQWPEGWKRTALLQRRRAPYKVTPDQAQREMIRSLTLLGADRRTIIVSSNVPVRQDGLPYANTRKPTDVGVAVYWNTKAFGERVVACDKWDQVHANIRAIGLALEGMRAIERAGATQILERAFTAFGALPPAEAVPVTRPWWEVFGLTQDVVGVLSLPMVEAKYRELAKKLHPDTFGTGSQEAFVELGVALEQAKAHYGDG